MARFVDAIDLPLAPETAFDLVADFARLTDWDPGAFESRRLDGGPVRAGSRFRVLYALLGRHVPLDYEVKVWERPGRAVLAGETPRIRLHDEIIVVPREGGARVTYEACVELRGLPAAADLVFQLWFEHSCRAAVRRLVAHAAHLAERARRPSGRVAVAS